MNAADLLALSDNEIAIHLNGGYGAEKRNQAMATVRKALKMATEIGAQPDETLRRIEAGLVVEPQA